MSLAIFCSSSAIRFDPMTNASIRSEVCRVLTVIDVGTRECVALVAAKTFLGTDVAQILGEVGRERGLPQSDQGRQRH